MHNVTIKPIGDRILVQYLEDKEQMQGGLFIPDSAKEKPQEATVVALGSGTKTKDGTLVAFEVKVGDRVLLNKFAGAEVKRDNQKYTIVRAEDILGILA